jgi:hypothetical protein
MGEKNIYDKFQVRDMNGSIRGEMSVKISLRTHKEE